MSKIPSAVYVFIFSLGFTCYFIFFNQNSFINRAFYIWESSKEELTKKEYKALKDFKISKVYIKLFEVEGNIPSAKTEFNFKNKTKNIEFIPTIYIRNEVFKHSDKETLKELAENIDFLIKKKYHEQIADSADIKEVQIDCDWTESTQGNYFEFLKYLKQKASYQISATLRLYAYKFPNKMGVLPVDRAMLMCYNLLNVHENRRKNSILDLEELEKYLRGAKKYPVQLDLALPIYQAMHIYHNNVYMKSLHQQECDILNKLTKHSKLWYSVKEDFIKDNTFTLAKITGVQSSNILGSSKVFRMTSLPIPFKSPIEIPTFNLSFMILCVKGHMNLCATTFNKLQNKYFNL